MKGLPEERAVMFAEYMIQNNATVRQTASAFEISKSTVHKDVSTRLRRQNPALWAQVRAILAQNKAERHLRGGAATKAKYCKPHQQSP
ncbi:MAG: sporulation transcriptional regulator SpoIIID [Faecalibacterium sp.]